MPAHDLILAIIPAFNEATSIASVVAGVRRHAADLADAGLRLQVCVVDDGSVDDTATVARLAGADQVLVHRANHGCGAAVRTGLLHARRQDAAIAVKLDGDGQHDPADLPALVRPILDDLADVVYGDRFPRISYRMPLVRRLGNAAFRALMRWLTGWEIRDSQPGIFAVNAEYLRIFFVPGDYNYTQQVLLDAYLKGMRFDQVPVAFRPRAEGRSFVSLRYPFKVLPQLLVLMVLVRPLKVFLPLAAGFLILAGGIFVAEVALWIAGWMDRPVEHTNLVLGLAMFGLNTGFFGLIAELVIRRGS